MTRVGDITARWTCDPLGQTRPHASRTDHPARRTADEAPRDVHRPRSPDDQVTDLRSVHTLARRLPLKTCRVHAFDGAIGLAEIDDKGVVHFVEARRIRVERKPNKKGGYRWYGTYELPEYYGGGGSFTIRLDQTAEDEIRGYNRTENVRVIPASDDDFAKLYGLRLDAESINRGLEDSLYWNRVHSFGHLRQQADMLGVALMVNSLARLLAERRAATLDLAV
jgi:hypothetical protein